MTHTLNNTAKTPIIEVFCSTPISFLRMKIKFKMMAPMITRVLTSLPLYGESYLHQCRFTFIDRLLLDKNQMKMYLPATASQTLRKWPDSTQWFPKRIKLGKILLLFWNIFHKLFRTCRCRTVPWTSIWHEKAGTSRHKRKSQTPVRIRCKRRFRSDLLDKASWKHLFPLRWRVVQRLSLSWLPSSSERRLFQRSSSLCVMKFRFQSQCHLLVERYLWISTMMM